MLVTKKDYFKILCWLHGSGGPHMLRDNSSVCPDWQRPGMFKFFLAMWDLSSFRVLKFSFSNRFNHFTLFNYTVIGQKTWLKNDRIRPVKEQNGERVGLRIWERLLWWRTRMVKNWDGERVVWWGIRMVQDWDWERVVWWRNRMVKDWDSERLVWWRTRMVKDWDWERQVWLRTRMVKDWD
jgi:hypothetical protein